MNKSAFCLIFLFINNFLFCQPEKLANKVVSENFTKNYNAENFEAIFDSFSIEMQKALPVEKTKNFLSSLKKDAGNILKRQFDKYEQGYASYKTTFDRKIFALNISVDNQSKINGMLVKPFIETPKLERNITKLSLPFIGEWTVTWGGDTKELNYHIESKSQKNAFDFVITDKKGKSYKTDGNTNEDYYAFSKDYFAPCDGEIVLVVDGVKENKIGEMNSFNIGGNTIIIKTSKNEFLIFCHLKHNSIKVKEGQKVKKGKFIGQCGNTGHSSEPHLHFHIQNIEDMNNATGVKCFFENISINGQHKSEYSPIKNDKIINMK